MEKRWKTASDSAILRVSCGAYEGTIGEFNRWRMALAKECGIPLEFMEGWSARSAEVKATMARHPDVFPLSWWAMRPGALVSLLRFDEYRMDVPMARRIAGVLPLTGSTLADRALVGLSFQFADGLSLAVKQKTPLSFDVVG